MKNETSTNLSKTGSDMLKDFSNISFYRTELQNWQFQDSILEKAEFTEADITNADFTNADCKEAKFTNANFTNANITNADCKEAKFTNTKFTNASFTAKFTNAKFTNADFIKANFTNTNSTNANFTKAHLSYANFTKANLTKTNLTKADFTNADLSNATGLNTCNLEGAKLIDVKGFPKLNQNQANSFEKKFAEVKNKFESCKHKYTTTIEEQRKYQESSNTESPKLTGPTKIIFDKIVSHPDLMDKFGLGKERLRDQLLECKECPIKQEKINGFDIKNIAALVEDRHVSLYEASSIKQWIQQSGTNPLTREENSLMLNDNDIKHIIHLRVNTSNDMRRQLSSTATNHGRRR